MVAGQLRTSYINYETLDVAAALPPLTSTLNMGRAVHTVASRRAVTNASALVPRTLTGNPVYSYSEESSGTQVSPVSLSESAHTALEGLTQSSASR